MMNRFARGGSGFTCNSSSNIKTDRLILVQLSDNVTLVTNTISMDLGLVSVTSGDRALIASSSLWLRLFMPVV